ncbi:hypothetical protein KAS08_05190 [Candidatus Pacearchaeota archaeon]|nr:hypothetical protein [Candidatus Pacearchaeota archaeon]
MKTIRGLGSEHYKEPSVVILGHSNSEEVATIAGEYLGLDNEDMYSNKIKFLGETKEMGNLEKSANTFFEHFEIKLLAKGERNIVVQNKGGGINMKPDNGKVYYIDKISPENKGEAQITHTNIDNTYVTIDKKDYIIEHHQ